MQEKYIPKQEDPLELHCIHAMEECGELIQAIAKLGRFGPHSYHPDDPKKETNIVALMREFADVQEAINRLFKKSNSER